MASVQAGLGTTLRICCAEADCRKSFTALLTERTGRVFDINKRSVLTMRRIGMQGMECPEWQFGVD